jgi:trimeric autotransporter adhesin
LAAAVALIGSLFASAPALAQATVIQIDDIEIQTIGSSTNTIDQINNSTITIPNDSPVIDDVFLQFALVSQSNRTAVINNGGAFDVIQTIIGLQANNSSITISNNGSVDADIFAQLTGVNQSNTVETTSAIINNISQVNVLLNNGVDQTNNSTTTLTNTAPVITTTAPVIVDEFTQSVETHQSNTITSSIDVDNSRSVTGISAVINNDGITQQNRSETFLRSRSVSASSFTQSAQTDQSNKIASSIDIENSGHVDADDTGILAGIINTNIIQTNNSLTTVDSGDVAGNSAFVQSAQVDQSNNIASSIDIQNSGHVEADNTGIEATIINANIDQTNGSATTLGNGNVISADSSKFAGVDQRNTLDGSSIAITNSGVVRGGDTGIFAAILFAQGISQTNSSSVAFPGNVDLEVADIFQTNILGDTDTITILNSGKVFGGTHGISALGPTADVTNTGLVHAYAQGPNASATGIETLAVETNIKNRAGTIWAGFSTDNGSTIHRGIAVDISLNETGLIQLQGAKSAGHIYGDINIASGNTIEVTDGKTFFEGTINGAEGTLDIFDDGKLVLCQEGWSDACDPNGWGDANWDPQKGGNGSSQVLIDTFTVQSDGTLAYQLTPNNTPGSPGIPGDYPQVFANTANLAGTLEAQFLPGFYANKTFYDNILQANVRNGTFDVVEDNSLFLKATAIYDGNSNVDLSVKRTPFNRIGGLTKNEKSAAGGIEHAFKKLPGPGVDPSTTNAFDQFVASLFTINNKKEFSTLLDQLTGAQFAQELQSVLWSLRPLNESITDRMDCSLNHSNIGPVASGYGNGGQPYGCFVPGQWQVWARAWGGWNHNDGDANAPGYDESQWAIWGGADYAISETFFLGAAGGFFKSDNMDFDKFGGVQGGSIEYDGGQVAGYGGWDNGVWYNRAIVSGGFYDGESHRNFSFRAPAVDPSGSPDADVVSFYNEAGRRFGVWTNVTLTPFAGITVAHADPDSFTENDKNNTGIALKVSGDDADSVASILGLRFNGSWGPFKPQVALGWEHEFDDTFQTVNVSFADAPSGSKFRVIGTDLGEDTLVIDAGASYAVGAASDVSVRYVGRFLDDYDAQSVMGRWTYKFGAAPIAAPPPPITNRPFK